MGGLLLVSLALGLDNFAAAIGIGLSGVDGRTRLKTGLAFGFFEALMPIVGLIIGQTVAASLGTIGHDLGAALLILCGCYVVWSGLRENEDDPATRLRPVIGVKYLLITGFALSLDNVVVGFALSLYHVPIPAAAGVIAVVSVSMSLIGLELGDRLGARFESWSEQLGGAVLILVGVALATGVL